MTAGAATFFPLKKSVKVVTTPCLVVVSFLLGALTIIFPIFENFFFVLNSTTTF